MNSIPMTTGSPSHRSKTECGGLPSNPARQRFRKGNGMDDLPLLFAANLCVHGDYIENTIFFAFPLQSHLRSSATFPMLQDVEHIPPTPDVEQDVAFMCSFLLDCFLSICYTCPSCMLLARSCTQVCVGTCLDLHMAYLGLRRSSVAVCGEVRAFKSFIPD